MTDVPLPSGEKNKEVFGKAIKASSVITKSAMWSPNTEQTQCQIKVSCRKKHIKPCRLHVICLLPLLGVQEKNY